MFHKKKKDVIVSDASDSNYIGAYVAENKRNDAPYDIGNYKKNCMAEKIQEKARIGAQALVNFLVWVSFAVLFMILALKSVGEEPQQLYLLHSAIFQRLVRSETSAVVSEISAQSLRNGTWNNSDLGTDFQCTQIPPVLWTDIKSQEEMWQYLKGHVIEVLYGESFEGETTPTLLRFNKLVGKVQLRQIRSQKAKQCAVLEELSGIVECQSDIGSFSQYQSKETYSPANGVNVEDLSPFSYTEGHESYYNYGKPGQAGYKYFDGGFMAFLDANRSVAEAKLDLLHEASWIDQQTRAVFLEGSFFNPNLQAFANVRMVMELPLGGGIVPWMMVQTMYIGETHTWVLILQVIFVAGVVVWTLLEADQIMLLRWQYLRLWHYVCPCTATMGGAVCGKVLRCRVCKIRWAVNKELVASPANPYEEHNLKKAFSKKSWLPNDSEASACSRFSQVNINRCWFLRTKFWVQYQTATALIPTHLYRDEWRCNVCTGEYENEFEYHKSRCLFARAAAGPSFDSGFGSGSDECARLPVRVLSPQAWKYLDMLNLLLVWVVITTHGGLYIWKSDDHLESLLSTSSHTFAKLENLMALEHEAKILSATVLIFHFITLSKHLQFFPGFRFLSWILNYSFTSVVALLAVLAVMLFFFAFSFHLVSGIQSHSHSTLPLSLRTSFLVLMGQKAADSLVICDSAEFAVLICMFFLMVTIIALGSMVGIFTNAVRSALLTLQRASGKPTPVDLFAWQVHQAIGTELKATRDWFKSKFGCCCSPSQTLWPSELELDTLNDAKTLQQGRGSCQNKGISEEIETNLQMMDLDQLAGLHNQVMYYYTKRLDETISKLGADN